MCTSIEITITKFLVLHIEKKFDKISDPPTC